jgi:HEAT repeat protein
MLAYIGTEKEVPALAEMLKSLDVREMARFALDANPSDAATAALIEGLADVGPTFRTGVVNALGKRRGENAQAALRDIASGDPDPDMQIAAVEALANYPDRGNDDLIYKMTQNSDPATRSRARKARVRLAATLLKAGNKTAARAIYTDIKSGGADPAQIKAAEIGLKATA